MGKVARLLAAISVILSLMSHVLISAQIVENESSNNLESSKASILAENTTDVAGDRENSGKTTEEVHNDLILANSALQQRILSLENRLESMEILINSLNNDVHFFHPTSEVQYVDMEVIHWTEAVKNNNLRNVAISFQAGYITGAVSSWEFALANENEALTVNLLLIEERYGRNAIFAGFTVYVLTAQGNVYSQANALPVNFLDGTSRTLHLPNVISFSEITNSSNGLLSDDVFRMRFRLELLATGHKIYSNNPVQLPTKDIQTAIFDVANLFKKMEERKNGNNSSTKKPLAYTKFVLDHEGWNMETNWSVRIFENDDMDTLALQVDLDQCEWPKLFASFEMEVWDSENKKLIHKEGTPVNDFKKDSITVVPICVVSNLKLDNEVLPETIQFKLAFNIYGRNARYYTDVI